jgi:hypothetical protein
MNAWIRGRLKVTRSENNPENLQKPIGEGGANRTVCAASLLGRFIADCGNDSPGLFLSNRSDPKAAQTGRFGLPLRFFAALLCALLTAASAYATDYNDVSVKVETVTEAHSPSGYDEYRVTVTNRSLAKPHRVTVAMYGNSYIDNFSEARRSVEVAPSSTATVSVFKPVSGGGVWRVTIDGERQSEAVNVDASRTSAWVSTSQNAFYLLSSRDVEKMGLMNEASALEGFKNASGEREVAYLSYKSPTSEWSGNWVGYSGFDAVALTAEELREAPDAVRSALWRFAECGGSLLIIGAWEIPPQWRSRRLNSLEVEIGADRSVTRKEVPPALSDTAQTYNVGFGQVTMIAAAGVKNLLPAQWRGIKQSWENSRPADEHYYDIVGINKDFPVVEQIGIPVRGLFVLMLAFVVVIGPVNLIWLARRRKKIWMLWTVPVIALVACLAVTGFALLGEGVSATSRAQSFTILDESSHRATTIGWTAFYAPIAPREGLHFGYDTELAPVTPEAWRYRGGGGDRTIDFSNDQHLDSGWITARVPAYFKFRKSETRRERLTIRRLGDSISVVNGLGADINALWVADRDGKIYSAKEIRAGAETKLGPTGFGIDENKLHLRWLFTTGNWLGMMDATVGVPQRYLAPGCYLAALDRSPFVEEGLKGVETRKGRALVYGVGAGEER